MVLAGTEVKMLRQGLASITESYAAERDGALYLVNAHIPEYKPARVNHEPGRPRKLLLHRRELDKLLRSEEHTSELQSLRHLVCRHLLEKKKKSKHLPQLYNKQKKHKKRHSKQTET